MAQSESPHIPWVGATAVFLDLLIWIGTFAVNIIPMQTGEYTIICTIFCGTGDDHMHCTLVVLS